MLYREGRRLQRVEEVAEKLDHMPAVITARAIIGFRGKRVEGHKWDYEAMRRAIAEVTEKAREARSSTVQERDS